MSPTISAVSKINASPRKKVLSDKNEVSRSEVKGLILEDTKSHHQARSCVSFTDVINIIGIDENNRFEGSHDMTITDYDADEVHENKGIVYSDPRFRISPRPSVPYTSPEFAAREVGQLLPPYDPKKNYLSPRPQFLHYKPNPRIEQHFDECKQLDELFVAESSSSDTELSVEESENCEEQEKDAYHEGGVEVVEEEETKDVEQLETESDQDMVCESIEETNQVPKQYGFRKFRFLGWFFALALGYMLVSATFSPPTRLLKESAFYEFHIPREITEFAKANNLEQLSEKLWTLTGSSLVYMDKLISRLGGREEEYGPLQFHNLTYILQDDTVFQPTSVEISVAEFDSQEPEEPLQEKSRGENNLEDGYVNEFEEESGGEENSEVVCETNDDDAETIEYDEQTEMKPGTDIELNEGEGNLEALFEDGIEWNIEEQRESEVNPEENDDAGGRESQENLETGSTTKNQEESEATYINQNDVESAAIDMRKQKESEVANAESESQEGFGEISSETSDDLHLKVRSPTKIDNDLAKAIMVLSYTVLVLVAAVAFLFAKKAKPVAASAPEPAPETTEELNSGHVLADNLLMKEKLSPLNFQSEEVDDRTSNSFHKKSSFQSNNRDSKEHESGGGNKRRESMASSASEYSIGSFSYGSFTTYEKIPIKSVSKTNQSMISKLNFLRVLHRINKPTHNYICRVIEKKR